MKKFVIPDKVFIVCQEFKIIQNKEEGGGMFLMKDSIIEIGTRDLKTSPDFTFMVLIHEISEIIHCMLTTRYNGTGSEKDYKFIMDHKEFENHNSILSGIIYKQLLKL